MGLRVAPSTSTAGLYLAPTPPEGWADLAEASGSLFATPGWAQVVAEGMRTPVLYAALLDGEGRAEVGLLGSERKVPGFRMFHSFFPYGGPVGDRSRAAALLSALAPELRRQGYHDLGVEDPDPELPPGLSVQRSDAMRHVLDLGPFDDVASYLASLSGSSRNKVSKARRRGVEVREAADGADVDAAYDLYLQAMARNHAPAWYPRDLFHAVQRLLPRSLAGYLLAVVDGEPVGMLALARSPDATHYWMGGSGPAALPAYANDLLFATAIGEALERGHRWFDFMGTRRDDEGLCQYKEKWGATRRDVAGYHIELSPLRAKMYRRAYHVVRGGPLAAVVRRLRGGR